MSGGWLILATLCLISLIAYWTYRIGISKGKAEAREEMDKYVEERLQELAGKLYSGTYGADTHFTVRMPGKFRRPDTQTRP